MKSDRMVSDLHEFVIPSSLDSLFVLSSILKLWYVLPFKDKTDVVNLVFYIECEYYEVNEDTG